jgi:hypothetical protein
MAMNRLKAEHRRSPGSHKVSQREGASAIRLIPGNSNGSEKVAARPMTVLDFQKMKDEGRKISMITCYDYSSARAVDRSSVDCILVGNSVAMTSMASPTPFRQPPE